jgi:hypothetical protein
MRATRLSKLWLKALRTDSNSIGSIPLNLTKISGQTAAAIEYRDTDDTTVLFGVDAAGVVTSAGGVTNPADNSIALAKLVRGTDGQLPVGQTGAATAYKTVSGDVTVAANGAVTIGAKKVTIAKSNAFYAAGQTGNAGAQVIAHGLGADPAVVLVIPTDGGTVTYTHDGTNVTVTCTNAKKYDVLAWA